MTVDELTRVLRNKGYEVNKYRYFTLGCFTGKTLIEGKKNGKTTIDIDEVCSGKYKVVFIHRDFAKEMNEMGLKVGTILK